MINEQWRLHTCHVKNNVSVVFRELLLNTFRVLQLQKRGSRAATFLTSTPSMSSAIVGSGRPFLPCELRQIISVYIRRAYSSSSSWRQDVRPSTAPKQFPDIKSIRARPELYEHNVIQRNYVAHSPVPKRIKFLSEQARHLENCLREPRSHIKPLEKNLAALIAAKAEDGAKQAVLDDISNLRSHADELEKQKAACDQEAHDLALTLPNITSLQTPLDGVPTVLSYINHKDGQEYNFDSGADHSEIGRTLSLLDFSSASTTTGWGFYYLLNEAALLEQALVQYALSVAMRHGWRVVSPPSLVYSHMADACGFQPRDQNDEQQIWQVAQPEKDAGKPKRSLAATAEIPLAGLYAGRDIPVAELPSKVVGTSRCYRAEAGARGVDTKGLYRVHEFTKVEMFGWTDAQALPEDYQNDAGWINGSTDVFDEMVSIQVEILTSLGLPCRVLEMPSNDLGASAFRKIDIEALFPSRMNRDGGWGEVTSASICTDYQSRRLGTRILDKDKSRKRFPHTVNGTAMAIPRVLAAILEHGWRKEGYVVLPEVLRVYMGGLERICR